MSRTRPYSVEEQAVRFVVILDNHARNPNFSRSRHTSDCCNRVVALSLTWGDASVKAFSAACIAAIVLAAISLIVLNRVQEPVDRAFATPPYTRVGD